MKPKPTKGLYTLTDYPLFLEDYGLLSKIKAKFRKKG